jgi:hypothetical protein
MKWEKPAFVEIGMNAEIGGYQSDFGDSEPAGPRKPTVANVGNFGKVGLTHGVSGASDAAGNRASRPL